MKNNLFANGLLAIIGTLLLLAALQLFGWGRGTSSLEAEEFDASTLAQLEVNPDGTSVESIDQKGLDLIIESPLFSFSRQPYIPVEDSNSEEVVVEQEAEPLKARVTSIIITDENSYVMVVDEMSKERVTLKQGMPLPGEQGLWVVDSIQPRTVVFTAEGKEPIELGLDVFDGQLSAGASNARSNRSNTNKITPTAKSPDNNAAAEQKNSAEEIRKKIAERRAQMRANAAKGKKQ